MLPYLENVICPNLDWSCVVVAFSTKSSSDIKMSRKAFDKPLNLILCHFLTHQMSFSAESAVLCTSVFIWSEHNRLIWDHIYSNLVAHFKKQPLFISAVADLPAPVWKLKGSWICLFRWRNFIWHCGGEIINYCVQDFQGCPWTTQANFTSVHPITSDASPSTVCVCVQTWKERPHHTPMRPGTNHHHISYGQKYPAPPIQLLWINVSVHAWKELLTLPKIPWM